MADPALTLVTGALRSCLNDHGPITEATLPSAAKRLAGQLRTRAAEINGDTVWKRKVRDLQHGHKILLQRHVRLRARLDAVRTLHAPEYGVCVHCAQTWPCVTIQAIDNAVADDVVQPANGNGASDTLGAESAAGGGN